MEMIQEAAWTVRGEYYLYIQECSEGGIDYTLYNPDFSVFDGGQFAQTDILRAAVDVCETFELIWFPSDLRPINWDEVQELKFLSHTYETLYCVEDEQGNMLHCGLDPECVLDFIRLATEEKISFRQADIQSLIQKHDGSGRISFTDFEGSTLVFTTHIVDPGSYRICISEPGFSSYALPSKRSESFLNDFGFSLAELMRGKYDPLKDINLFGRHFTPFIEFDFAK